MIKFQSLPRQKRQAIRDEVLRLYSETDLSYGEIAEENDVQVRTVEYIIRKFPSLTVCGVTHRYSDSCHDDNVAIRQPSDYLTLL